MKMMWETPVTHVEALAADNYCASVCFNLACVAGTGSNWGPPEGYTENEIWGGYWGNKRYSVENTHSGSCASSANNYVNIEDGQFSVYEVSSDQGRLEATFTKWIDQQKEGDSGYGEAGTGDIFSWVTFANNDNRIWLHWAYASPSDPNAPLRHS